MKSQKRKNYRLTDASPPSRGAWIEMFSHHGGDHVPWSPPSRGAWIEMFFFRPASGVSWDVAPLAGGVD